MKPLIDRIREAGEFDAVHFLRSYYGSTNVSAVEACTYQHAKSAWMREALEKAVDHIEQTEWLEYHACVTGDCEHKAQYECFVAITDEFKQQARVSIEVRAEIAALVPQSEKPPREGSES